MRKIFEKNYFRDFSNDENYKKYIFSSLFQYFERTIASTVKLGNKERFDKEQIGIKELFMDYQPFYTINLLLDKELLPI